MVKENRRFVKVIVRLVVVFGNHTANDISKLSKIPRAASIEKYPGPTQMYIDSCKTITASYSQANELVFRQNSGQQCVAMSPCAL